jgi:hypothetical protein
MERLLNRCIAGKDQTLNVKKMLYSVAENSSYTMKKLLWRTSQLNI